MTEADEEYLDFMQEKRRQMFGVTIGAGAFGALATVLVAGVCGGDATPGLQAIGTLLVLFVLGLVAYGSTQGGTRRSF